MNPAESLPELHAAAHNRLHSVHADRYAELEARAKARRLFLCNPDESCSPGEPTDDDIYFPSYVGPDGPTKAA